MNYICREHSLDRETVFSFSRSSWSGYTFTYVDLYVKRISDGIGIHRVEVQIANDEIKWHEYHLREDHTFTTPKVRSIIERMWKMKAFI